MRRRALSPTGGEHSQIGRAVNGCNCKWLMAATVCRSEGGKHTNEISPTPISPTRLINYGANVILSHTYSEFANGTPRCIAAEHASKRFSSAGSPSTCAAWHVERHGIGRPLSDLAAAPQPSTPGPWALGSLRAGAAESRKGTAPRGQGSGLWHRQSRTFRARHHLDELAHELV